MQSSRVKRYTLALLLIAIVAVSLTLAFAAAQARADDGSGMNMTPEEMQNMATPAPTATAMSGGMTQGSGEVMDPNMDMSGGSANLFVVGGVAALIAGATLAAVLTKRHLRRRMLTGELATAGTQDV